MKKLPFIGICGLATTVAALGYFYLNNSGEDARSSNPAQASSPSSEGARLSGAGANTGQLKARKQQEASFSDVEVEERLQEITSRRPRSDYSREDLIAAMGREQAWTPSEEVSEEAKASLPLSPEEFNDGRRFLSLDSLKIETLMPGDSLKINVEEEGEEYDVTIDRVEKHTHDSISWYGHIDSGDGQSYDVSFTRGQTLTVAGLRTPEGQYSMQAHGSNGWIAPDGLLFKYDPDHTDALVHPDDQVTDATVHSDDQ